MEVRIHKPEAINAKKTPNWSAFKARAMPGDISQKVNPAIRPARAPGNRRKTRENFMILATSVQNSRRFAWRELSMISGAAISETITA